MTRSGDPRAPVLLLWVAAGCAVTAGVLLVASQDARWLRLGLVAALWAALAGASAATRWRREAAARSERAAELRQSYQLELEREVAARREYELELETDLRRQVQAEVRADLDGVRAEMRTLRATLEQLLGGEVLVERVALRGESTRVRALSEQPRVLAGQPSRWADERRQHRPGPPSPPPAASPRPVPPPWPPPDRRPSWQREPPARTPDRGGNESRWPAEPGGAHTSGRSVSELLAAHGSAGTGGRRRRRED